MTTLHGSRSIEIQRDGDSSHSILAGLAWPRGISLIEKAYEIFLGLKSACFYPGFADFLPKTFRMLGFSDIC